MKRIIFVALLFPLTGISQNKPDLQWFRDAKFGLFIHWGLYSKLAGTYNGINYYGSGEWIMNRAKIPAAEYAHVADSFNPVNFDADKWAELAKESGIRYVVITAKHHEGFSMFDSKVSDFNIVKATPYKKDPMKALANSVRDHGMKFGFYYSQYLDWHEPNGGGNDWDFDESKKNYLDYYHHKSIPQLQELLRNYGPLGLIWFDMPGGLTAAQTKEMTDSLHRIQPAVLFSSRVGQGLGDYTDFGDSEIPPLPVSEAWESIYTHNDSWGYIAHDLNFKSPQELIRLLAGTASKGGNLMLNVGPDGTGRIPALSEKYLRETGRWLKKFGESIFGTTYGLLPAQPWGVTTTKPGRLFLHVMERPKNGQLLLPDIGIAVDSVYQLDNKKRVAWKTSGRDVYVSVPELSDPRNTVFVVAFHGNTRPLDLAQPLVISDQYTMNTVEAAFARTGGHALTESLTHSHYFGDWKHANCVTHLADSSDAATFSLRFTGPGDYRIILEYSCPAAGAGQEGIVEFNKNALSFSTLFTGEYNESRPLLFIKHSIGIVNVGAAGIYPLKIHPRNNGKDLFNLKSVLIEPVN